ncbi:MAG: hypothetical protein ACJAZ0_003236 [Halioglobus sp.]|jgi:hypothetical protein
MPLPVNCFVIGAQKAGTTTLASLLAEQADICVSTPKEPLFFSKNFSRGESWYNDCFKQPTRSVLVDASPDYSRGPTELFPAKNSADGGVYQGIPEKLFDYNPHAKFVYILRNPVSRTHSSYWHNMRASYEGGQFSELIRRSDRYLVASDYLGQIKNYFEYFKPEQFHFVLFEELVKQPDTVLQQCCAFLECEYHPPKQAKPVHKNASYQLNTFGKLTQKVFAKPRHYKRASQLMQSILPEPVKALIKRLSTSDIPAISHEDHLFLTQLFASSNDELAKITGLNLDVWKK